MRGHKLLIREAELMAMQPEAVASFLKERAGSSKLAIYNDLVDRATEAALLGRKEPLVDLALARYGLHHDTVAALFQGAAPDSGLRLACLSNQAVQQAIFLSFPLALFGSVPAMLGWIGEASPQELTALFENPSLNDSMLCDLLKRRHDWNALPYGKLIEIVFILNSNPRMRTPREDDWMDGYAEYSYGAVFNAAWSLAESAEPNNAFASALGWLFEQLQTDAFSIKDPLAIAGRWHALVGGDAAKTEANQNDSGSLSDWQRVRKGLARLALSKDGSLLPKLLASEDIALRCAAYASGDLSAQQIMTAHERDGELAYDQALRNQRLWRTSEQRQALHDAAWKVVNVDKHSDLLAANLFNSMSKEMRKSHPDWFLDEAQPDEVGHGALPATRADVTALAVRLDGHEEVLALVKRISEQIAGRSGWIWWFSLGALAASLWRH